MSHSSLSVLRPADQPAEDPLTTLLRQGARQLITQTVEAAREASWGSMMTLGTKAELLLFVVAIYLKSDMNWYGICSSPGAEGERPLRQRQQVQIKQLPPWLRRTRCLDEQ